MAALCMIFVFANSDLAGASTLDDRRVNVFQRYGLDPVGTTGFSSTVQFYNKRTKQFDIATSPEYGLVLRKLNVVIFRQPKGQRIINTDLSYRLANGGQKTIKWSGKSSIKVKRTFGKHKVKATLLYAIIGAHNPRLPNR